jgi:hypothetical protein
MVPQISLEVKAETGNLLAKEAKVRGARALQVWALGSTSYM